MSLYFCCWLFWSDFGALSFVTRSFCYFFEVRLVGYGQERVDVVLLDGVFVHVVLRLNRL